MTEQTALIFDRAAAEPAQPAPPRLAWQAARISASFVSPANARARRVLLLLILFVIVKVFYVIYTIVAHQLGGFEEINPLARQLLDISPLLVVFKLLLVGGGAILLWLCRRHWLAEVACWFLCGMYTVLAFLWVAYYEQIGGLFQPPG